MPSSLARGARMGAHSGCALPEVESRFASGGRRVSVDMKRKMLESGAMEGDTSQELSDLPSQAGSRQGFAVPHLGDIGLVGVLAVLRGGTNIYKYTTASGGHRRHLRHFQIRGADEEEAIAWRNASWISIRKERSVFLRNVLSVHYGHGDLASLGEAHPGSTMIDAERCFSVKYLDPPPSGDSRSGSVRYLHLCAQTSGDFSTWRRGLQALLAQRQQPDHQGSFSSGSPAGIDSTYTSCVSSNISSIPAFSNGYSEQSHMSSAAESQGTASTVPHGSDSGRGRGGDSRQAEEGTLDKRVKIIHNAYHASPSVQSSVVKLQALVRGFRTRAASSRDIDWAWNSLQLRHEDKGDLDGHGGTSPGQGTMSPRTSDLESLRYDMLPDGPEDVAQSGLVIRELRRARDTHKRVEGWALDEEHRIHSLTARLQALLESQDAPGAVSENDELADISISLDEVTRALAQTTEQLEHLCGVDQHGLRIAVAETGAVSLFDCHQDTKAAERKLQTYEHHLSSVLEPALARIGRDIERIRGRATENCEELGRFEREVESRPAPASGRFGYVSKLATAALLALLFVAAVLPAKLRTGLSSVSLVDGSSAAAFELAVPAPSLGSAALPGACASLACRLGTDVEAGKGGAAAAAGDDVRPAGAPAASRIFEGSSENVLRVVEGAAYVDEEVVDAEADGMDKCEAAKNEGSGSVFGEGPAGTGGGIEGERVMHGLSAAGGMEDALVRARARAALERERMQAVDKARLEAQRAHEQYDIAALYPDLGVGGVYAETLTAFIRRLQASLSSRAEPPGTGYL